MKVDIAKVDARWKKGMVIAVAGALWLFHITTAVWFATHCETTEGLVLKREERSFFRKRGWAKLEVSYPDATGKVVAETIRWHVTPPPPGQKIPLWRADTGLTKVGPASLAETFFFETLMGYVALFVGIIFGVMWLTDRQQPGARRKR